MANENNILTVPVTPVEGETVDNIKALGLIVTWSAGHAEAQHQASEDSFAAVGLGDLAPKPRTLRDSLHCGLVETFSRKNRPVRPTPRGYEVVEESAINGGINLTREHVVAAWIERDKSSGAETIRVDVPEQFDAVKAATDAAARRIDGTAIGKALTDVASKVLKGVLIREAGGAFWLPPSSVATWNVLTEKLAATGAVKFRKFTVTGDSDTVDSLVDSAKSKVEAMLNSLVGDLDKGTLGPRALSARAEEASRLAEEITAWESVLGRALDAFREKVEEVQVRAAQAALAAMQTGEETVQ